MALSRKFLLALKASLTVAFIFLFLTAFPSLKSVGLTVSGESNLVEKKLVLGSKPPGCVNKCLNCRPCTATLVIPSNHDEKKVLRAQPPLSSSLASHGDDGSYYLLSWKCKCGDKLFQP
ncbi:hypothetical protein LWI29_005421 [Acer saccharum]|uniref:Epidermal patterning factor-like protein n=1 Tax=Acer saccharum TaxID=4024 RepID=A0AA39VWW9_ACESA|nr:hypothetical protein LWI29_005421 [Acer saccharum]KAK1578268.1 hypothetical protein Q3G72_028938 [Acer saccharum]KAK1582413.1 hypothetical protein Q3G72_014727 [Acer saccharum]